MENEGKLPHCRATWKVSGPLPYPLYYSRLLLPVAGETNLSVTWHVLSGTCPDHVLPILRQGNGLSGQEGVLDFRDALGRFAPCEQGQREDEGWPQRAEPDDGKGFAILRDHCTHNLGYRLAETGNRPNRCR